MIQEPWIFLWYDSKIFVEHTGFDQPPRLGLAS